MNHYISTFLVTVYDTDCQDQIKFSSLCNFLQECSRHHGEAMGLGIKNLANKNQTWLLHSLRIELERRCLSGERLTVKTWSRGCRGLKAMRDFSIHDSNGIFIGAASTQWILIDKLKMKPNPPGIHFPILENIYGEYPLDNKMGMITTSEIMEHLDSRQVRYNEIDINGHVNNTKYVSWIEDTLGSYLSEGKQIKAIELQYIQGAKLSDTIKISGSHSPHCQKSTMQNYQFFDMSNTINNKSILKAMVEWI